MRMESKGNNIENHQNMLWSTWDGQEIGEVRLYKCTFCERGFSNAQALGGHMNIHRKDRARLKEFPELEAVPSSSTVTGRDTHRSSHDQLPSPDYRNFLQSVSSDHLDQERNWTHQRPLIFMEENDQESSRRTAGGSTNKEVMQLPLFVERSSTSNEVRSHFIVDGAVEKTIPRTSSLELDLELRLGPERHA